MYIYTKENIRVHLIHTFFLNNVSYLVTVAFIVSNLLSMVIFLTPSDSNSEQYWIDDRYKSYRYVINLIFSTATSKIYSHIIQEIILLFLNIKINGSKFKYQTFSSIWKSENVQVWFPQCVDPIILKPLDMLPVFFTLFQL